MKWGYEKACYRFGARFIDHYGGFILFDVGVAVSGSYNGKRISVGMTRVRSAGDGSQTSANQTSTESTIETGGFRLPDRRIQLIDCA